MKHVTILGITAAALTLAACGGGAETTNNTSGNLTAEDSLYNSTELNYGTENLTGDTGLGNDLNALGNAGGETLNTAENAIGNASETVANAQ